MASVANPTGPPKAETESLSREDQTLLLFAGLMEGGKEDDDTCRDLGRLTKLLNDDAEASQAGQTSICRVIDGDCVDTMLGYLDMRQADVVRGHATVAVSSYLKTAGDEGAKHLSTFFYDRIRRGTYDDYIVAFCVAAAIFPIVPDLTAELFLHEGFVCSLGPLMRRKWKSKKVETACLEMLNAACMNGPCREAVQKYCTEWLEEIVDQDPEEAANSMFAADPDVQTEGGSISMRRHSQQVQNMAAVILTKLRATQLPRPATDESGGRVQSATSSIEDLSNMFVNMLLKDAEHSRQSAVEGLAYASLQPTVKEQLSQNDEFLEILVATLDGAPPRSPLTYGALTILANLTKYQPVQSEEEKRIAQLRAYANALGKLQPDPLNDEAHVSERCKRVFKAGVTPVLVKHSKSVLRASQS